MKSVHPIDRVEVSIEEVRQDSRNIRENRKAREQLELHARAWCICFGRKPNSCCNGHRLLRQALAKKNRSVFLVRFSRLWSSITVAFAQNLSGLSGKTVARISSLTPARAFLKELKNARNAHRVPRYSLTCLWTVAPLAL